MRYRPRLTTATALLATAVLGATLTACSSSDGGSGGEGFTYWSMWQESEPQGKVVAAAIAEFEQETGVDVEVQWQGRDNVTKLVAALRGGDVPDLVDQQYFTIENAIVGNGQFTDLSDVYDMPVPGERKAVRDVVPAKYDPFVTTDDGARFLVPYEVIAYTIWYDAARLPDVATQPPRTWEEFAQVLAASKAAGRSPLALDADIAGYAEYWTSTALVRALGAGGFRELVSQPDAAGVVTLPLIGSVPARGRTCSSPATTAASSRPCRPGGRRARRTSSSWAAGRRRRPATSPARAWSTARSTSRRSAPTTRSPPARSASPCRRRPTTPTRPSGSRPTS